VQLGFRHVHIVFVDTVSDFHVDSVFELTSRSFSVHIYFHCIHWWIRCFHEFLLWNDFRATGLMQAEFM